MAWCSPTQKSMFPNLISVGYSERRFGKCHLCSTWPEDTLYLGWSYGLPYDSLLDFCCLVGLTSRRVYVSRLIYLFVLGAILPRLSTRSDFRGRRPLYENSTYFKITHRFLCVWIFVYRVKTLPFPSLNLHPSVWPETSVLVSYFVSSQFYP